VPAGQDTPRGRFYPSQRRWVVAALASFALAACRAQASGAGPEGGLRDEQEMDAAHARAVAEGRMPLPERGEALTMARSARVRADREGAGARAVGLYTVAARLFERLWRASGRDEDANEAIDLYRAGSRDVRASGACEAAFAGSRLIGDFACDPGATYAELYRMQRRFAPAAQASSRTLSPCGQAVEDTLALLVAFRPSPDRLARIDDGLSGEGAMVRPVDSSARAQARPPQVMQIESWPGREAARVVIVLDRPAAYRVGDEVAAGGADPRTFLDFDGVELGAAPKDIPADGIVRRIRAEATTTGSRVSLDLDGHAWRRVFEMREPYRVVIDVARRPPGVQGSGPRTAARVVIDPGHGGSDDGARGPTGLQEKDVALDIAHRVAPALAAQGIEVVLTRDDDHFVSLEERTARANAFGADLFVSIHCNASEGRGHRAIESYVLDTNRDAIAARVAARENATTETSSSELAAILGGLRMADSARHSKRLAQLLLRASTTAVQTAYGDAIDGGVHAAGFYVLVGARMPAVLFETSYISNATDEQRLASPQYRQLLADAIANALRAYREGR
jgi:N-acetylmuramoyl-L-alanine amidase